jgi:Ca-activated chloride channel homolog
MKDAFPLDITFLHPGAAWLALLLVPLLLHDLWWRPARRVTRVHRALRAAVFLCVIAALMQPGIIWRKPGQRQMLVVDRRVAAGRLEAVNGAIHRLILQAGPQAHVTLVEVGTGPAVAADETGIADRLRVEGNSLSAALDTALSHVPVGSKGQVTVIGDGASGDAHWGRAVDGFLRRGMAVSALALAGPGAQGGAFVADVRFAPVRVGEMARAGVRVEGTGGPYRVTLMQGEKAVAVSQPFHARPGLTLDLRFPADQVGFTPLRAVLTDVQGHGDASLSTVMAVQDPLHLLYMGERQAGAAARLAPLLGKGFAVDARGPSDAPTGFGAYQAVMLDDLPAARLPAPAQRNLLQAVRQDGLGLFYAGGQKAFATGGYDRTPLGDALPVSLRQDEKLEQPSVALAIVIDTSGSMKGQKIDLAKQVARFAVGKLTPLDSVGVVEFYGAKQWAVPMQPAKDTPEVERAIGRMEANGSSVLFPAIQEAYYALKGTNARYRHILVITDAGVEEQRYQQLLTHIADDRITVSTALVGADPEGEEKMALWARWGRGRYYAIPDEFSLVELNLKQPQIKPSLAYRQGSYALQGDKGVSVWQGMRLTGSPPVQGYVPVGRRDDAETLLTTATGDPVLASWQWGNGRVTALMSEPLGQGTQGWQSWAGYGQWLGSLIARTAGSSFADSLEMHRAGDTLTVTLYHPGEGVPQLRLTGASTPVPMEERAPGLYTAVLHQDPAQPAMAEVRLGRLVLRAADRAGSDIGVSAQAPDRMLPLDALAHLTGGAFAAGLDAGLTLRVGEGGDLVMHELWPCCALLALVLYLLDIIYRRWPARRRSA